MALQLPFVILLRSTQNYLSKKPVYEDLKTCINLTVSSEEPLMLPCRLKKFKNCHAEKKVDHYFYLMSWTIKFKSTYLKGRETCTFLI